MTGLGAAATARSRPRSRERVSVFTEARFGRGDDGRWRALHRAEAASVDRFRRAGRAVAVVARADATGCHGGVPVEADLVPLPYYVGVRAFVRVLPRLVPAVLRAVRGADRIVLRLPGTIGAIAATICRLTRRRYAVEVAGDPVAVLHSGVVGWPGRLLAGAVGRHMCWAVGGASATTYVTAEALQRLYPPGRRATSVAISDIRLDPGMIAASPPRPEGSARLVTVGHQDQHYKGHDVLLRAIAILRDEGLPVQATVVGGGRLHDEVRALRDGLGLEDSVVLSGTVNDRSTLTGILDSATVFVLPSRTEGLPRALVEAMARGLPAIGTAVGGVPELLEPPCLVRPGDAPGLARAIRLLLTDGDLRRAQAERNLEVARRFDTTTLERRWALWVDGLPPSRPRTTS